LKIKNESEEDLVGWGIGKKSRTENLGSIKYLRSESGDTSGWGREPGLFICAKWGGGGKKRAVSSLQAREKVKKRRRKMVEGGGKKRISGGRQSNVPTGKRGAFGGTVERGVGGVKRRFTAGLDQKAIATERRGRTGNKKEKFA